MAKITAWLVTLIGLLLVLAQLFPEYFLGKLGTWTNWIIALAVLSIGIAKLLRNYSTKKKR